MKALRDKVRKDKQNIKNAFDKYLAQVKYEMGLTKNIVGWYIVSAMSKVKPSSHVRIMQNGKIKKMTIN